MIRQIREQMDADRKAELLREEQRIKDEMERQREEREVQREEAERARRRAKMIQQVCPDCGQLGILPCGFCDSSQ